MLKHSLLAATAAVVLIVSSPAHALTLTNRDAAARQLTITDEDGSSNFVVEPDQTLNDLCTAGCTIVLEDGSEETFEGDEVLEIVDGSFAAVE